jgi:L-threonylcarbamoyladenylate synthase
MKTHIVSIHSKEQLTDTVESAVYLLGGGYPIALPTETVYGLAGGATNPDAVLRIFNVKERPKFDPLIVHLPTTEWLDQVAVVAGKDRPLVNRLIERFWPGPMTLILPKRDIIPDLVTAGLPTVAVRMSSHPVFRAVVEAFGQPLAAPSANRFGRISPTTARDVAEELGGRIHLIVDGGPTTHGVESTIVMVRGESVWIVRSGPITADDLQPYADEVALAARSPLPSAPGQMKSHYAPATPVLLLPPGEPAKADPARRQGLLAWCSDEDGGGFTKIEILSRTGNMKEAAASLFSKLRLLDNAKLDLIVAESVPEEGIGIAIMDRLRKAAGHG